ncbi:hypothetical protein BJV38_002874 [Clostridium beijerinckii]|uniref:hypothetical protein n=1 Tax=Clostridium beijerinckii TaxID=1520 RepID=UPI001570DEBD|nr:hypothetical protein [Clostridium beijerinckii]NRT34539.1 hypothetical protein [Clostridium beijerinckii]NRT46031.1 hypothetical protein [Clostridium beijerinckii]NRZ19967.1 hypothetical protein [Clostridium beijerinckii]
MDKSKLKEKDNKIEYLIHDDSDGTTEIPKENEQPTEEEIKIREKIKKKFNLK